MLTMKAITFLLLLFLSVSSAWAQSKEVKNPAPPITKETNGADKSEVSPNNKQTVAIELPPTISVTVGGKLELETDNHNPKAHEERIHYSEWLVAFFTGLLVFVTAWLVHFTKHLWAATYTLAKDAKKTATQQAVDMQASLAIAKQAADATTKAADAAIVASMPVLSPFIVGGILHPFPSMAEKFYPTDQPTKFESSVHFVFENFGKTPGMIREVRGDLFLCEMDQFPTVEFEQLPIIDYQPIVAGDSRGEKALMGVAEYVKMMSLSPIEYAELLTSADQKYRRFAFIGRVIYDDFFGNRHTRRFCVKTRLMDKGLFQLIRGGQAYNHVDRQKIPEVE